MICTRLYLRQLMMEAWQLPKRVFLARETWSLPKRVLSAECNRSWLLILNELLLFVYRLSFPCHSLSIRIVRCWSQPVHVPPQHCPSLLTSPYQSSTLSVLPAPYLTPPLCFYPPQQILNSSYSIPDTRHIFWHPLEVAWLNFFLASTFIHI